MKTLAIIGSTGSIGKSTLNVYKRNKSKFNLLYLAANSNFKKLNIQEKLYKPKNIFLIDQLSYLKNFKKNKKLIEKEKLFKNSNKKIDYVISGISSFEAININFDLLKISKNLLIANKETIICGGQIFLNEAKKNNCNIIPIDSEHHCIDFFLNSFNHKNNFIDKIYIAASGGPFFRKKIKKNEAIKNVLDHPTWKMGKKITVDSSTFANKVLELFEAKILFDLPSDKLKIIVEEKSNIHSIIKLKNNLYFPIIHNPNMEIPISNSLNVTNNFKVEMRNLQLTVMEPDSKKFPIISLGNTILKKNLTAAMILFVVFNERLVKKYLKNQIKYGDIALFLVKAFRQNAVKKLTKTKIKSLKNINNLINIGINFKL